MWRIARKEEHAALVDMCRELNREDPCESPVPDSHMIQTLEILTSNPLRGLPVVLEVAGAVAGYALLISFWSNELGGEVCTIDELYVRPPYRGRGFAKLLVQTLQTKHQPLWPRSIAAIELEVSPANVRARKLYSGLGFQPMRNSVLRHSLR